jgi:divalent metal cation (Fe/Co/Zn/Cd) transporter
MRRGQQWRGLRRDQKQSSTLRCSAISLVAVTKFAAALLTGSSSMLSEGVRSLVDTGNEALPLYGYYRSALRPDARHPLGYCRELEP